MYRFLVLVSFPLRLLPLRWLCTVGRAGGYAVFILDRSHRRLAISHLRLAYPEQSEPELFSIAKKLFIRLGEGFMEFLTYRNASLKYCLSHTQAVNEEIPHQVMARGKGMIFLTAHYGNWEGFVYDLYRL